MFALVSTLVSYVAYVRVGRWPEADCCPAGEAIYHNEPNALCTRITHPPKHITGAHALRSQALHALLRPARTYCCSSTATINRTATPTKIHDFLSYSYFVERTHVRLWKQGIFSSRTCRYQQRSSTNTITHQRNAGVRATPALARGGWTSWQGGPCQRMLMTKAPSNGRKATRQGTPLLSPLPVENALRWHCEPCNN